MDHKKFYFVNKLFHFLFIALLITSCGSYQYSGYINDGIYQSNDISKDYAVVENQEINNKANNDYYKSAFNEKALMYSETETSDQLFTDVENYRTSQNDTIEKNYGPWGDYKDSVVINIHSYHHDGFWSRWRYPNWMWNYGFGYGSLNTWGYGYNNYWSRPFPFYGGMYDPFNPFWGYYDSFYFGYGYGYGYAYGYYPWWRPYNSWYNYNPYGRDFNSNVSFISGRRSSRNMISNRSNNFLNTNISDRFNRSNSNSLSDRLSRIDRINSSARVNPNMYNKPFNNAGSSNSLSKPSNNSGNGYYNNSKPSNNNYSIPSNNYSRPSNDNYKPSGSSSSGNFSRPSYSPSSSSSYSRGGGGISSGSSPSRGGKSGR